jgi:serine/threonine protein kinase
VNTLLGDDELLARVEARLGRLLRDKYRLDRVLGVGGMAAVYAATHRNTKRFAVKMLHPELSLRADIRTRFLREGYAANSVGHAGTVAVLDDDVEDDGSAFLVMELLEGETVEELWQRSGRRLALEQVVSIGHQLLDVLAAAHANGIVHRDIKPANLFVTRSGELKVLDFGIARVRDVASTNATQTGATMGTPAFMAPEQALGNTSAIDARTDVWAVGATLFTVASGRFVHQADNAQQMMVRAATQPALSLGTVLPDAPPSIIQAVDRALAFEMESRWPSAVAMRDAIRDASVAVIGRIPRLPEPENARDAALMNTVPSDPPADAQAKTPSSRESGVMAPAGHLSTARPVSARMRSEAAQKPAARGRTSARARTLLALTSAVALALIGAAGLMTLSLRASHDLDIPIVSTRQQVQDEFRRAVQAYLDADIEAAERGFRQAQADEPKQPWPYLGLALTYAIEQRFDESSAAQASALDLVRLERAGDSRDQQLMELLEAFDSPTFAGRYAEYFSRYPRYFVAQQAIAYYGIDSGSRDVRVHRFDVALAIDDRHPITYLTLSWLYQKLGETEAAKAALAGGLARRSTAPWLLDQRGVLRLAEGDITGAKQDFERALADGPRQTLVHYAMALLRSGAPGDEELRVRQVASMMAIPNADLRVEAVGQHVMALYARGRAGVADVLLADLLRTSMGMAKAGTIMRCLLPPIWVDDALGRYDDAQRHLGALETLLRKPDMGGDKLRQAQWMLTALQGIVDAETGKLAEAKEELHALSDVTTTETLHHVLVAELDGRIQLHEGGRVTATTSGPSLALRVRAAHLKGRLGERDADDAGAEHGYASLVDVASECSNADLAIVLTCAPYVADGLAHLAQLQMKHGRPDDVARTLGVFDAMWPSPDPGLAPTKIVTLLRAGDSALTAVAEEAIFT